ncbi:MAG: precorrin-3B C(17)-methyltransferase [Chloroflexi bacterium]|nr:precorrin-3B C(17)-methyltransferase [Chloroflexota bacterium]
MEFETRHAVAIVAITRPGVDRARTLLAGLPDSRLYIPEKLYRGESDPVRALSEDAPAVERFSQPLAEKLGMLFNSRDGLVLFMALGAAFRLLSPHLRDKRTDPAVVVVDDKGKFAISALSGHRGGANDLARRVADILGGRAVITTASDVGGTLNLDLLGKQWGWQIEDERHLTAASAALVNGSPVAIFQDAGEIAWMPSAGHASPAGSEVSTQNIKFVSRLEEMADAQFSARIVISDRLLPARYDDLAAKAIIYRPKSLIIGVGCRRGTPEQEIEALARRVFEEAGLSFRCIRRVASMDIKKHEPGLLEFAHKLGVPAEFFTRQELDVVRGAPAVCEPASLLSAMRDPSCGEPELIVTKRKTNRVTIAVTRIHPISEAAVRGKLYVVGVGPGDIQQMTPAARRALAASDTIVGYRTYLEIISPIIEGKRTVSSGMKAEISRAAEALDLAREGATVSLVSGGDAGIYGMAGLAWELMRQRGWQTGREIDLEVVPGMPALNAAASLLGAPLAHDFAVISLSDLLTSWQTILERLEAAAKADFVVVLYNPKSQRRTQQIVEARNALLRHRPPATPVGVVTNAYRGGQRVAVTDLGHLLDCEIDMLTIVVIGNSSTFAYDGKMVTPRGYPLRERNHEIQALNAKEGSVDPERDAKTDTASCANMASYQE